LLDPRFKDRFSLENAGILRAKAIAWIQDQENDNNVVNEIEIEPIDIDENEESLTSPPPKRQNVSFFDYFDDLAMAEPQLNQQGY
jgi:hypothetical protein